MVPSYSGTPCLVAPPTGFFQSFVPVASPMKLSTPMGALSGNSVQVILPAVVSMIAVGWAGAGLAAVVVFAAGDVCVFAPDWEATDAGVDWAAVPDCADARIAIEMNMKIASALRMGAPREEIILQMVNVALYDSGWHRQPVVGVSQPNIRHDRQCDAPACISRLTFSTSPNTRRRFPPRIFLMSAAL